MTIIHHVSIVNRNGKNAFEFYRNILGLDLLMKTVNQDDNRMYHLFFGDKTGRPGTEVTIFEITEGIDKQFGTNDIDRLVFKVQSTDTLKYFMQRFDEFGVCHYGLEHYAGRDIVRFEGPDDTNLGLVVMHEDEDLSSYAIPVHTDIPEAHRIIALDSVHVRTRFSEATVKEINRYFDFEIAGKTQLFDTKLQVTIMSNQNNKDHHEIHVIHDNTSQDSISGIGSIHHVAMSAKSLNALQQLEEDLNNRNILNSRIKNREFFQSLYYRDPNNILIEVATMEGAKPEQPNKESKDFNAIPLVLPEYLEPKRAEIEARLS
ncbi:VOC family protein [Macrococcus capreoli]|uniref:VOC family protein n=1 Tax=Macrococcus capreoli TaxID=2982690 RepID=UPI0021D570CE|nr:VOC family protein [Macrococcus sp. TMW 2.2395]MCU7556889.1 VOC family protein [Macrococcus sp. TMW 2.2395]